MNNNKDFNLKEKISVNYINIIEYPRSLTK